MNDQTNRRKRQHIEVIGRDEGVERNGRFFDAMQLQHRAMPEINLHDLCLHNLFLPRRQIAEGFRRPRI